MMTYRERALICPDDLGMEMATFTVLDVQCSHCGDLSRILVREEWKDWKLIAKEYETRYRMILSRINELVKECETECGPLPSTMRFKEQLLILRAMAENLHKRDNREKDELTGV